MRKMKGSKTAQDEGRESGRSKRMKDSGNGQRQSTRESGRITEETKEREREREISCKAKREKPPFQRKERIDETARKNDIGSQRQKEWTKERERTEVETKDRNSGRDREKEVD